MHGHVNLWAETGYLSALLDMLHNMDFCTWLTSDHGNLETIGCGRPAEGAIAEHRGERVRIYRNHNLRAQVKAHYPGAIEWHPVALPNDFFPLVAPDRKAFTKEGERAICHGGISLEELVVPFIEIIRRES